MITVSVITNASINQAWQAFVTPSAITHWNFASADWCCPHARNDLRIGGQFCYRMEARDGSFGFDFEGEFIEIVPFKKLRYSLGPEREVIVQFEQHGEQTRVSQSFTPEDSHPLEQQREGWQSILNQYKHYVESHS